MFGNAGLLAQNRKLANVQKFIGNRNRIVQLAELGKKKNPIGILRAAEITCEAVTEAFSNETDHVFSAEIIQLQSLVGVVYNNINKSYQNNLYIESAINAANDLLKATSVYERKTKAKYEEILELYPKINVKMNAEKVIERAFFYRQFVTVLYNILLLSKTEPTIGGRSTRRNRKNNRKTRRN
jgi:hypothetical protein